MPHAMPFGRSLSQCASSCYYWQHIIIRKSGEAVFNMNDFKNVTVVRKANSYFDGKVTSRTVLFASGERKTLGIMMPGTYRFDTAKKELMEIQEGMVEVLLPGATTWKTFRAGESFEVPAHAEFDIKAVSLTDYCCSYLD